MGPAPGEGKMSVLYLRWGSRVGVRSRGLSPESNRSQTAPNGRCYHYTTKPSRVKDAGARLVGWGADGLRADIPRIIATFDDFFDVLR